MQEARTTTLHELLRYQALLHTALKTAKICVFEVDLARHCCTAVENAEDIFGVSGESLLKDIRKFCVLPPEIFRQKVTAYFFHPDDAEVIAAAFDDVMKGKSGSYHVRIQIKNMRYIWCKIDIQPVIEEQKPVRIIGVITDIDKQEERVEKLKEATRLDRFTGLCNKTYFEEAARVVFEKSTHSRHALIIFDMDDFKNINDTYGHLAGDKVLRSVSHHLKKIFRRTDIIARFGGDEFIILLRDLPDSSKLLHKKLKELLSEDNQFHATKSIGIAIYPDDGITFENLLKKADSALYYSKKTKRDWTLYSEIPPPV